MTALLPDPPGWMDDAVCVNEWATFDAESASGVAAMKSMCADCPVIRQCAKFAVATDARFGVWAGHEIEANRARPTRLGALADIAGVDVPTDHCGPDAERTRTEHGTRRGYGQHIRFNTPVCEPCRFARREYDRERDRRLGIERAERHIGEDARRGCG